MCRGATTATTHRRGTTPALGINRAAHIARSPNIALDETGHRRHQSTDRAPAKAALTSPDPSRQNQYPDLESFFPPNTAAATTANATIGRDLMSDLTNGM